MKKLWLILLLSLLLSGCATGLSSTQSPKDLNQVINQALSFVKQFDDANAARTVKVVVQINRHWEMNSTFWRTTIGNKLNDEKHLELKMYWDKLDALHLQIVGGSLRPRRATTPPSPNPTEAQAGEFLAWWLKWVIAGARELGNEWLPVLLSVAREIGITL